MASSDPTSWYFHPCVMSSQSVDCTKWQTSNKQNLAKDSDFCLAHTFSLTHTDAASFHVASCPMETATWSGTEGGPRPTSSEELNHASSYMRESGSTASLDWALRWESSPGQHLDCSTVRDPGRGTQLSCTSQKLVGNKCSVFKHYIL